MPCTEFIPSLKKTIPKTSAGAKGRLLVTWWDKKKKENTVTVAYIKTSKSPKQ